MKRLFDIVCSTLGLLVLLPAFVIVVTLIKIESPGPGLYTQQRVARGGKMFNLFKFRTMHVNADKLTAITVGARDPRITRIGYYLRKYKIDELPQLINVMRGDMSLVGPRPELKKFVDLYTPEQREVLTVRPGITDFASLEFRNENELLEGKEDPIKYYVDEILPAKLALSLRYVRTRSFLLDIKIILRTIKAVFVNRES
jgi:lipopolysaccharide/colanic/teichoic acid biosynthesis glycosyltransferase